MINFPVAKINLGLNVVSKREDGYHNLETVFYPVPIKDALEVFSMHDEFPSEVRCDLKVTNLFIDGDEQKNLVVKAYNMIARDYNLPRVHVHLYKHIPTQAGMGGGSSDCAYMIRLLNVMFSLGMSDEKMIEYAARLGADCAFFITADPSYAEGFGDVLMPVDVPGAGLGGYYLAVVKPSVAVSTRDAYAAIVPKTPSRCCRDIVRQPIETWKDELVNDFEAPIFAMHPELAAIKQSLYDAGAVYAAMSGSGSALFGIFREQPTGLEKEFEGMFCQVMKL